MAYDSKSRVLGGEGDGRGADGAIGASPGRRTLTAGLGATPRGAEGAADAGPGRRTLTAGLGETPRDVGAVPGSNSAVTGEAVQVRAAEGVAGSGLPLPHLARIQTLFGRHDVSSVIAHVGGEANDAAEDIGADAYAAGDHVAFTRSPDLHTAAHEAAHVIQQRGGVQLKDSVGRPGDAYERHANAVADRVGAGQSAEDLLDQMADGSPTTAVQMQRASATAATAHTPGSSGAAAAVAPPASGLNRPGFIDHPDGSNIRTAPAESGGQTLTPAPLPPATQVFVSGHHPDAAQWWYVTAFLPGGLLRGYVQNFRVTTDVPEPSAKLYQIRSGDTVEAIARREFSGAVRDGHDLRYYENVLLAVNRDHGRSGITGTFQDPNILGGGANNIQLVAGQRIWLVSPTYARAVEGEVPNGSLTNGAYAGARRALRHLDDILTSVTDSPNYFGVVAGEYAAAIRAHLLEIVGITAGFILAEATSAFLAATPTGVGQLAAVMIQLALAAFGAAAAIEAGAAALQHGERWLTLAWTANGDRAQIQNASEAFLRMLVSVAMAALAALGVRSNLGRSTQIANAIHIQPPGMGWAVAPEGALMPSFSPGAITTDGAVAIRPNLMAATGAGGARAGSRAELPFPRRTLRGVALDWLRRNKPRGWRQVPTRNNEGWIWLDTAGRERLRFMRPNGENPSASQWSRQANGYFRWQDEAGNYLDINGNVVAPSHPQFNELTHIVYEGP